MYKFDTQSKNTLILLTVISLLVISTLAMFSNYFLRPSLELDLKNRVTSTLSMHNISDAIVSVDGRDVILNGIVYDASEVKKVEAEVQNLFGVSHVKNKLVLGIKN